MFCLSPFAFPSISVPSGGDAGGGGFEVQDLSSGFTTLEPDGLTFSSATTNGSGVSTFTFNALATGDSKYDFSGSGQEWPRLYKDLADSTGTLSTDDPFLLVVRFTNFSHPTTADFRLACGLCLDPTSTTSAAFDGYAITFRFDQNTSFQRGGRVQLTQSTGSVSAYTVGSGAAIANSYGVIANSSTRLGGIVTFGQTSANEAKSTSSLIANSNAALTASTDYKLWIGVATTGAVTVDAGQAFSVKIETQIVRLVDP